ncbi:hypothetical protein NEUTE1DRAFT_41330 [Neurospora tetrasperma FGSC 2508]|uniref:Uncharacterized protein n=1 Tax=Neurospora tetrasperma (strain FGSC 2508 / ATCC MYA-4615 / P0657) TaxID=510951 RepID=F8ML22_NEUT8|nr:uncharacterized protein NEUTE1DRAFT_41330 [Neurospora tetrasperma FGSC 2508]EGO58347.1 hypothetical protein NEUTE1DRAFT_41330 [Neurospora tetrasperma FGSC 2508]EGZ71330.1 hypothetical protein NEUTE2DRAFT_64847 [Neurospora tetrasperma FGSC 2509]
MPFTRTSARRSRPRANNQTPTLRRENAEVIYENVDDVDLFGGVDIDQILDFLMPPTAPLKSLLPLTFSNEMTVYSTFAERLPSYEEAKKEKEKEDEKTGEGISSPLSVGKSEQTTDASILQTTNTVIIIESAKMSSQSNIPRDTQLRNTHPPSLQQPAATASSPTLLEEIAAEVEAARWAALPIQYLAVFDPNDPEGDRARELDFYNALAGADDALFESIYHHVTDQILRNRASFQYYRDNAPPPYTTHPTKGEITVEMSPEVVLPAYLPPYTPFGQGQNWEGEDAEKEEEEGVVVEDVGEKSGSVVHEMAATNPELTIPFLCGRRIPLRTVEEYWPVVLVLVLSPYIYPQDPLLFAGFVLFTRLVGFLFEKARGNEVKEYDLMQAGFDHDHCKYNLLFIVSCVFTAAN